MTRPSLATAAVLLVVGAPMTRGQSATPSPAPESRWYKGNTHTHTHNTDGDSSPIDVVRFYREQGYNFLVLSDHDSITPTDGLNAIFGTAERSSTDRTSLPFRPFLLISGHELTDAFIPDPAGADPKFRDLGRKEVHLTALGGREVARRQQGNSVAETLQRDVDAIRRAGGLPIINHPNFVWSLTAADLKGVRNAPLVEIWNGHMQTNNLGGGDRPSVEAMWDEVLSAGVTMYGVAADDAHFFKTPPVPSAPSSPGRAYVMVRSARFTAEALLQALERGDFYASTGVELAEYSADSRGITVRVAAHAQSRYRVTFIGRGGRTLRETWVTPALPEGATWLGAARRAEAVSYFFTGNEGYVRVKIADSNGLMAWTQPVRVSSSR
jgi:hypothetical protein